MGGGGEHHHVDGAHGHGGDFRAKVWSMSGGPYCRPKHWKRNTAFAMFGIVLVCIPIAMKSAELEVLTTTTSSCLPNSLSALVQEFWEQGLLTMLLVKQLD
ncbi:uncharacterized protein LOC111406096 [Olea europaea subsp. europaea]|uniref:Uncharacterized protein LOC111406096 n=1 Tax=Olea europaea subsp. europaea TaxID=158383 RepID=A0A8S0RWR8_OLEEU|nr:uncharacterized protein LOC111406096 [Olea europaea subsp. europaea]